MGKFITVQIAAHWLGWSQTLKLLTEVVRKMPIKQTVWQAKRP